MDDGLSGLRYMERAIKIVQTYPFEQYLSAWHACVIVKGGAIISEGVNKPKTNMFIKIHEQKDHTNIHAECDAILRVRKKIDLTGAKAYVVRILKDKKTLAMSKPCNLCQERLKAYGIKRVVFSTGDLAKFERMKIK